MGTSLTKLVFGFLGFALLASSASAQSSSYGSGGWSFVGRKAEVKRQARWTLDEWLATRDRMRWSDMWLALNSPSPYEFFVIGAANLAKNDINSREFQFKYGFGAYASIFGIEFDHEDLIGSGYNARLHVRIFGTNVQNTNLTLHVGLRQRDEGAGYRQTYAGASTTLYWNRFFGIFGQYRYYFGSTPGAPGGDVRGPRYEGGPFLDFGPFRIFGNYVYERESGQGGYSAVGKGWMLGGQLFF